MNTTTHPQTDTSPTMRAIVQDRYGSSDTWQLTDIGRPEIKRSRSARPRARCRPRPWNLA